jgi:hypothetical protein
MCVSGSAARDPLELQAGNFERALQLFAVQGCTHCAGHDSRAGHGKTTSGKLA